MNKKFAYLALVLVAVGAVIGGLFGRMPTRIAAGSSVTPERVESDYRDALKVIDDNYAGPIDHEKTIDSSMQAMLWTLDPHSSFFSSEELKKLDQEQASQFYGIGVSILQHRDGVYVQSIVPGTPADKAGLRYGDRILSIDNKDAKDWTSAEVSKNVRGERSTSVHVQVERVGSQAPIDFDITRGGVPLPSIRNYFMLPNGVGYVGLTGGFQQTTGDELTESINELKKRGMKSLILDLRANPGGILEEAVAVVSKFIPAGQTVVSIKSSRNGDFRDMKAIGGAVENVPLVVMMNGGSASASEIVAGAIQDYDRGIILGTDSFGKGLVQHVYRLPYSTGMTLTTARYYTPFGRSLQRDYSSGSIYDYYTHGDDSPDTADLDVKPKPAGSPVTAANGRVLYGGRGIEPDVVVKAQKFDALRGRLNEAAFLFTRQLVAGKIAGFESMKADKQSFKTVLQPGEFAVSDKLLDAFKAFAAADPKNGLTAENVNSQADYAKTRLREEIATATDSQEAGVQALLETDPQVLKAIEVMPQASGLVARANTDPFR
jgi:carboxyl-terminal processing protease